MKLDFFCDEEKYEVTAIGGVLSEEYTDIYLNEVTNTLNELNTQEMIVMNELKEIRFR